MLRIRFKTNCEDYRPVKWPIKHPYWCTGTRENNDGSITNIVVSYADDEKYIKENWPEAFDLDVLNGTDVYTFTGRFPKPVWLNSK